MSLHPLPPVWLLRLKAATRDLRDACGGVERAAALCGLSKSQVSRCASPEHPDLLPLAAVLALEADCGLPLVTAAMAGCHGRTLARGRDEGDGVSLAGAHADVTRAAAGLMGEAADAFEDGAVSPAEAERIDRRAGEVEIKLGLLRKGLARAKTGGKPGRGA